MFVQIVTQAFNCFLIALNIYKNIGFESKYHVKAQNIWFKKMNFLPNLQKGQNLVQKNIIILFRFFATTCLPDYQYTVYYIHQLKSHSIPHKLCLKLIMKFKNFKIKSEILRHTKIFFSSNSLRYFKRS